MILLTNSGLADIPTTSIVFIAVLLVVALPMTALLAVGHIRKRKGKQAHNSSDVASGGTWGAGPPDTRGLGPTDIASGGGDGW